MKILILIPIWKRTEILKICIKGIKHLQQQIPEHQFIPLFIISLEDPYIRENFSLIKKYKFITYKNIRIAEKHNAGVNYAIKNMEWDYLMNLGSDDIINPSLFKKYYNTMLEDGHPLIGLRSFHVYSWYEKIFFHLPDHNGSLCIGGARMIAHDIILWLYQHNYNLYSNEISHGLDANSFQRIYELTGYECKSAPIKSSAMLIDIKTHTNINHILQLKNMEGVKQINEADVYADFPELQKLLK